MTNSFASKLQSSLFRGVLGMGTLASVLLLSPLLVTPAFADIVDLTTGGHLLGETPIQVGKGLSEDFTLNAASTVTVMFLVINSGECCQLTETEVDGNVVTGAVSLAAGTHTAEIIGLECDQQCLDGFAGFVAAYQPGSYSGTGGSIQQGFAGGFWALDIVGTTDPTPPVPEPGTLTLLGTGLLGLGAGLRRKFWKAA